MTVGYRAAWVPEDDPQRPSDEAAGLAIEWVRQQANRLSRDPLLVTYSLQVGDDIAAYYGIERATVRSPGTVSGRIGRPVIAYVPYEDAMCLAHRHARNAALCVVEAAEFRLHGWAREVHAENLLTGKVLPALDPAVAKVLDRLMLYANNGWGDQFGRDRAGNLLSDLRPHVDRAEVLGYVTARDASDNGIKNLQKIMDKMGWRKHPN
jgi:hypothetical protein